MPKSAPNAKIEEALAARDALAAALSRAGIQLPAMDVRTPWNEPMPDNPEQPAETKADADTDADGRIATSARYALVHLGVCSAPVALALAAVIAKGAQR